MSESGEILLVGCGNMGRAMLDGWLAEGRGADITVIDPAIDRIPSGVRALAAIADYDRRPGLIVLAVKPQMLAAVAPDLARVVTPDAILLSILAAIDIATLRRHLPGAGAIVRAVPNLPATIGAGVTALAAEGLDASRRAMVTGLCEPLGAVEWLDDEALIDVATAISGCGPAFLFRFADAVVRAGTAQGMAPDQALRLFAGTMVGAGRMLVTGGESPGVMASRVASPGGVTLAGLAVLDREDAMLRLVGETLTAASRRNAEIAAQARGDAARRV